jgi:pyridoxamine 5'-phosphate oxidase
MKNNADLGAMRVSYSRDSLTESECPDSPWSLFFQWFTDASSSPGFEANAMTLSTIDSESKPNSRIVLLKEFNESGFSFFTNLESSKASDLDFSPYASLLFFWFEQERQVRIKGKAEKLSDSEASAYFSTRPRESQLGAWASKQSSIIKSREALEQNFSRVEAQYPNKVPKPPFWGGYRVKPSEFEFWQGRVGRLHDRILYASKDKKKWSLSRLAP